VSQWKQITSEFAMTEPGTKVTAPDSLTLDSARNRCSRHTILRSSALGRRKCHHSIVSDLTSVRLASRKAQRFRHFHRSRIGFGRRKVAGKVAGRM
jgi:hypothetical protein